MQPRLDIAVTRDPAGIRAARALRHAVFVSELGAAPGADAALEGDAFDDGCDHVLVRDTARPGAGVVATARLRAGTDWTGRSFDLRALTDRHLRIAEIGRVCLHPDYRGGAATLALFDGVTKVLRARRVQAAIGTASFPGADPRPHLPAMRALRALAPAPPDWDVAVRGDGAVQVLGAAPRGAMAGVPSLVKTYLRAGAWVGAGAHVDPAFGTVDVCLILDMARLETSRLDRLRRDLSWRDAREAPAG